jgi:hypothetical protein
VYLLTGTGRIPCKDVRLFDTSSAPLTPPPTFYKQLEIERGIFASWWRFHGELLVSPPTQAKLHVALLHEIVIGSVQNGKEVSP